jgi:MerR family transcriptional regulator/heat shock protein HspR
MDDSDRPMYLISIVAEMLDVHPQTLRTYEREGLVSPGRSGGEGSQRLYSKADVERLGLILDLTRNLGVNRAGVDIILRMRQRLESLQEEVERMLERMDGAMREEFQEKIRCIFEEEEK